MDRLSRIFIPKLTRELRLRNLLSPVEQYATARLQFLLTQANLYAKPTAFQVDQLVNVSIVSLDNIAHLVNPVLNNGLNKTRAETLPNSVRFTDDISGDSPQCNTITLLCFSICYILIPLIGMVTIIDICEPRRVCNHIIACTRNLAMYLVELKMH